MKKVGTVPGRSGPRATCGYCGLCENCKRRHRRRLSADPEYRLETEALPSEELDELEYIYRELGGPAPPQSSLCPREPYRVGRPGARRSKDE